MSKFQTAVIVLLTAIAGVVTLTTGIVLYSFLPDIPNPSIATPTPTVHEWRGEGDDVLFFNARARGAGFVGASFTGDSNFSIVLYRDNGEYIDLLVNDIGNYNGQTSFVVQSPGRYYLQVEARGRDFKPLWVVKLVPPQ